MVLGKAPGEWEDPDKGVIPVLVVVSGMVPTLAGAYWR